MRETKAGFPMLMEASVQHRFVCKALKNGQKKKEKAARPKVRKARDDLMSLNMSEEEADKIIKAHPQASDDELVMEALKEKEKMAMKAMKAN